MESKRSLYKKNLLNSLIFSGFLIVNIFNSQESSAKTKGNIEIPKVVSYRSASCGCCKKWVNHLRSSGLEVVDNVVEDISAIKIQYQITNNLRSCHTAKMGNYLIEGHVPFESIKKLNLKSPTIAGIAVPWMPHGSPGMELHNHGSHSHKHYKSYKVYSFGENIEEEIFDKVIP